MTNWILEWLTDIVLPLRPNFGKVFEIGSLNVNGSARDVLQPYSTQWVGCDFTEGPGVDIKGAASVGFMWAAQNNYQIDTVVACECYEHDPLFFETHRRAVDSLKVNGIYIITSPTIGFPIHDYNGDYYRFTEQALTHFFFRGMEIVDVRTLGKFPSCCVAGVAIKTCRV